MSKRELNELRDLIEQLFADSVAGKLENKAIPIGKLIAKTYYHTKRAYPKVQ